MAEQKWLIHCWNLSNKPVYVGDVPKPQIPGRLKHGSGYGPQFSRVFLHFCVNNWLIFVSCWDYVTVRVTLKNRAINRFGIFRLNLHRCLLRRNFFSYHSRNHSHKYHFQQTWSLDHLFFESWQTLRGHDFGREGWLVQAVRAKKKNTGKFGVGRLPSLHL